MKENVESDCISYYTINGSFILLRAFGQEGCCKYFFGDSQSFPVTHLWRYVTVFKC